MHIKQTTKIWGSAKWLIAGTVFLYALYFVVVVFAWDNWFNQAAKAQNTPTQDESVPLVASHANVASSLFLAMGADSPDLDLDFKDIFGGATAGQNLYTIVYNKLNVQPEKQAFKESAQAFGLTLPEAAAVRDGSPTPFIQIEKDNSPTLTQAQALRNVQRFTAIYNQKQEYYQFQSSLITEFAPSEIFYNGELSDSGFDLVYDLQVIEQILFAEKSDITMGGDLTGGLPGGKPLSGYQPPAIAQPFGSTAGNNTGDTSGDGSNSADSEKDNDALKDSLKNDGGDSDNLKSITDYAKTKSLPKSSIGDLQDPTACTNDFSLGLSLVNAPIGAGAESLQALSDSLANQQNGAAKDDQSNTDNGENAATDPVTAVGADLLPADFPKSKQELEWDVKSLSDYYKSVPLAKAEAVKKGDNCVGPICFEVKFKYKTASLFIPGETCVACEVGEINDDLWNTIKNNLSANKAPGNIFEPAKCKASIASNPNLNIVMMFNPIKTPTNEDLIIGKDVVSRWNDFKKLYKPGWFTDDNNKREDSPASKEDQQKIEDQANQKDIYEDALQQAANSGGPSLKTQQELQNEINKIVSAAMQKTEKQVKDFEQGSTGAEFGEFYNLLSYEMDEMKLYLSIYYETINDISSQICPAIRNKSDVS